MKKILFLSFIIIFSLNSFAQDAWGTTAGTKVQQPAPAVPAPAAKQDPVLSFDWASIPVCDDPIAGKMMQGTCVAFLKNGRVVVYIKSVKGLYSVHPEVVNGSRTEIFNNETEYPLVLPIAYMAQIGETQPRYFIPAQLVR